MDLRSIINIEAGDVSPITKQAAPETPDQSRITQVFRSYSHPAHSPQDNFSSQTHRLHLASTPTNTTYSQNFHDRRPPPPIEASPQRDFRSPAQSLSTNSQYPTTPLSATSQFSFSNSQKLNQIVYLSSLKERISPSSSSSKVNTHSSREPVDQTQHTITLTERHREPQDARKRSISVSPKTRLPNSQKQEISLPVENININSPSCKMKNEQAKTFEGRGLEHQDTKPVPMGTNLNIPRDFHTPPNQFKEPPRKRTRYTEPPIWARSVRDKGNAIILTRESAKNHPKQTAFQAHTALSTGRAQINNNSPNKLNLRATATDLNSSNILGVWQESITGKKPTEPITKTVADFFFQNIVSRTDLEELSSRGAQIEIEAKLGEIIDKETKQRYYIPVKSECVLADGSRVGFISSMTEHLHKKTNEFLNDLVRKSAQSSPSTKSKVKIEYTHRRETDVFYELPKTLRANLPSIIRERAQHYPPKVRVTHDQKDQSVLAKIIKIRVSDLDIYSGTTGKIDCRISINLEIPYDGDLEELKELCERSNQSPSRNKDRLSYKQSYYQIDLTQISVVNGNRIEKEHELEIEISSDAIMNQGRLAAGGQPNEYLALVEGFLNNVRVLSKFVSES